MANRKHYRRRRYNANPAVMGLQLPSLMDVVSVGVGFVVPPIITSYVMGYVPESWKTSKAAFFAVKAASVVVPAMLVRRFLSRRAGNLMLLGGAVNLALDLIKEFLPGVIPGLGYQPLLGAFVQRGPSGPPIRRTQSGPGLAPMIASTPDRLNPAARF